MKKINLKVKSKQTVLKQKGEFKNQLIFLNQFKYIIISFLFNKNN